MKRIILLILPLLFYFYSCDLSDPNGHGVYGMQSITIKKLYIMNQDGSNIKFLTYGGNAQFSSDGNKIYYGNLDAINIDGSGVSKLIPQNYSVWNYCISGDGKKIVFSTYNALNIMNCDGTGLYNLLSGSNNDLYTASDISLNDSLIVFGHNNALCLINSDGCNYKTLLPSDSADAYFLSQFAENGSKLIFLREDYYHCYYMEDYTINPPYCPTIYNFPDNFFDPTSGLYSLKVSPQGIVLFTAGRSVLNKTLYIHQMDLKTFKETPITDGYDASYSKDFTKIIYTKPNDGSKAIYIYDLSSNGSGSSGAKVINTNLSWANIQHPKLSPDGNHILFEADSTYQVKESSLK